MQRDENLLHINNAQQIDAIHMVYRQTGAPIRSRIWIGSKSNTLWAPGLIIQ